ncbi:ABC transporter permease, partial [Actinomadura adrarensis]
EPLDKAGASEVSRMTPLLFDVRGIVPIGYAFFAFVLGVAVGMLVRRALVAMAVTVVVFTALQIAVPLLVRPYLLPPTTATVEITRDNLGGLMAEGPNSPLQVEVKSPDPGAWILTNETLDKSGNIVRNIAINAHQGACAPDPAAPGPAETCFEAIRQLGYEQRIVYHAADRFWPLQWIETGLYLLLGFGLAGFCFYRIRRNLT